MPYKVLLADGSLVIQKVVEDILGQEGFEIKTISDGEKALEELDSFIPHIILADIELNRLDGYRLCKEIKDRKAPSNIPVILLAGAYEPFDEEYASRVGADDFILKPFESKELLGKIKKLLKTEDCFMYKRVSSGQIFTLEQISTETEAMPSLPEYISDIIKETDISHEQEMKESDNVINSDSNLTAPAMKLEANEAITTEELDIMLKKPLEEVVNHYLKPMLSKDILSYFKASVKSSMQEIVPAMIEDLIRQKMNFLLSSLSVEIEAEIKRALPEIVEKIIKKEFER